MKKTISVCLSLVLAVACLLMLAPQDTAAAQPGWSYENNAWYYLDQDGTPQTGWIRLDGIWYYLRDDGRMVTGWNRIDGFLYYMDASGHMQTGWTWLDDGWHYFDGAGHAQSGWCWIDGWYYLSDNGGMITGWQKLDGIWYYMEPSGHMVTGWNRIDGFLYYMDASGHMQTGWTWLDDGWHYFDGAGHAQSGWCWLDGEWYYLSESGHMLTGWQEIDGKNYYFHSSGHMLRSTWIDGRYVGSDGAEVDRDIPSGSRPYYVDVNTQTNSITVYQRDENGFYSIPYKAMVCSSGLDDLTPKGEFRPTGNRWYWLGMIDDTYAQYVTQFKGNFLFHSVPYEVRGDRGSLCPGEFDKLGEDASHGCIRLQVKDAKWIFDHMDDIDRFHIFDSPDPGPLGKPEAPKIGDSAYPGWDPSDPDPDNPWNH